MFLGAYSIHSGTRGGVLRHLSTLCRRRGGRNEQIVLNILNYVTRHYGSRLVRYRRTGLITNPSTCLSLPRLVNRYRRNCGTVGAILSAARACHGIAPLQVNLQHINNFIDVVEKYGGFYRCYVIPCAHNHRHDERITDVLHRIRSL